MTPHVQALVKRLTTADAKIAAARELMIAATRQRRSEYQMARAADRCQCGHRRDRHTVTCSINYTQGFCMAKDCQCRWYLQSAEVA